jgi:O-antigen/teichoic acid export membrane protein
MRPGLRTRAPSGVLAGVTSVGSGVLGAGVFTYLFLSLAGRVLGPAAFAPISTLWAMVFIVGPGLFLPVQQELGRVIAGQRLERGGRHAVTKVALLAGGLSLATMAGTLAAGPWIIRELFNGNAALLWCFEGSVLSYALTFMVRGVLSGLGEFTSFGRLVATEALARLVVGAALALVGARSVTAFGIAIVAAPILSTAIVTRLGARVRLDPGTAVSWREVTRALGWLVLGSTLAQFLANAGPLAVQLLATNAEAGEAGRFLSALVVARLGLYLFQAVQATLLPNVAELVAKGRVAELDRVIRRVTAICLALAAVTTVGAFVVGAVAVRVLFGSGFAISGPTMAMLAGASSVYVLAMALSGVAIASAGHRLSALSWLGGCCAFVLGTALSGDLFLRVEIGYLLGSCAAAGVLLVGLPLHLRRHHAGTGEELKEASPPAAF